MGTWLEIEFSNALIATLLAVIACALARVVRRPGFAYAIWLLVLAKLLAPPLVNVPMASLGLPVADLPSSELPQRAVATGFSPAAALSIEETLPARDSRRNSDAPEVETPRDAPAGDPFEFSRLIRPAFWAWLGGAIAWFALAVIRIGRFSRIVRRAAMAPETLRMEVRHLAARLGLRGAPDVRFVGRLVAPLVWAMSGRATVVLPRQLLEHLSAAERETLLVHELAHLARRDHLVRWLELIVLGLYWWHPVAWWARRNVQRAEELCCDLEVMRLLPNSASAYASAMLATALFLDQAKDRLPLGAQGFFQATLLKRRMTMVLDGSNARRVSWPLRLTLATIAVSVLPLAIPTSWAGPRADAPSGEAESPETDSTAAALPSMDQRLDRLEKMMQTLLDTFESGKKEKAEASPRSAPNEDSHVTTQAKPNQLKAADFGDAAIEGEMANIRKRAKLSLELSETNFNRRLAAGRQVEAVIAAYDAQTVTIDHVLDAVRRALDTRAQYARTVGDLCADPLRREFLVARAQLSATNEALKQAQGLWKKAAARGAPGAESSDEAQAREQYFSFKSRAQQLLTTCSEAVRAIQAADQKTD